MLRKVLSIGLLFSLSLIGYAESPPRAPSIPQANSGQSIVESELKSISQQAYVWGWPMVYLNNCRRSLSLLSAPGRMAGMPVAPVNQLAMLTEQLSPAARIVPCPNRDVAYGFGLFDLNVEPVVVQVPDFGDRYWLYQLGDQRTDSFAKLGKQHGTQPGCYLIVGPNWSGEIPTGIVDVFRCPTNLGYCIPRVQISTLNHDAASFKNLVGGIHMYSLSQYRGKPKRKDWTKLRWYPSVGSSTRHQNRFVAPENFFDAFAEVIASVPPLPGEESLYVQFENLVALGRANPEARQQIEEFFRNADQTIVTSMFDFENIGEPLPFQWRTIRNGAAFGTDYTSRASIAKSNIFVNTREETCYYYLDRDASAQRLDGHRSYEIRFEKDELPNAHGFWSLTLYDENHRLFENEHQLYAVGTNHGDLKLASDGSLTIVIQSNKPDRDSAINWLPAPNGPFSLCIRVYGPDVSAIDRWNPPGVFADHVSSPVQNRLVDTSSQSRSSSEVDWNGSDVSIIR